MDDPIFDPWTDQKEVEERAKPEERPGTKPDEGGPRWTSPSGSRGVPVQRPVPAPRSLPAPRPEAAPASEAAPRSEPTPRSEAARRFEAAQRSEAARRSEPQAQTEPAPSAPLPPPAPPAFPPRARRLRETVLPRLEWLAREVQAAGHRAVLDDRLDGSAPSVRFRLAPRPGPFEETELVHGAVIEIGSGPGDPLQVVGRLWMDPLSPQPTEEVRVPAPKLTEAWVDRLLLDFVEKALERP